MDVQLVNDVSSFLDSPSLRKILILRSFSQGPVTLILDSDTDAPARPSAKTALSNDLKQKRKEELAAKALAKSERLAKEKAEREATPRNGYVERTEEEKKELIEEEAELIKSAEEKSKELADRFKVAMTESY